MNKQHQSQSLKKAAHKNIKTKHKVIKAWIETGIPYKYDDDGNPVRDGDGEMVLDYYPTSLRSFYKWNGDQNCQKTRAAISAISGTGTTTLDNLPELKKEITNDLKALEIRANSQITNTSKTAIADKLRQELKLAQLQRESAEQKYLKINVRHQILENALRKEQRAHQQSKKVLSDHLTDKDREIEKLRAQLSELIKTIDKVSVLKTVR
ncbi:MAG: hypothetical protein OQL11_11150 [Gammaproteobacteria bacterium]|nr:hypothetical protein [Gammaproteobacteria bacterium]